MQGVTTLFGFAEFVVLLSFGLNLSVVAEACVTFSLENSSYFLSVHAVCTQRLNIPSRETT